jgi:hypothetical protein
VRKFFIAAIAAAIAVSGFAVLANAGVGPAGTDTSWTFDFKPAKKAKPASTHSVIEPAVHDDKGTDDPDDDTYAAAKKTTIVFPKGGTIDTSVPKICKAGGSELANSRGAACNSSAIGTGAAKSIIGEGSARQFLNADIKAYNKKNGIFFLIQPCFAGSGPTSGKPCTPLGNPFVLEGKYTLKNSVVRLIVPTPKALLDNHVIIQRFELKTKNFTRKRNGKIVAYATTPAKCPKHKWTSSANVVYTDHAPLTIKDTQACG